MEAGGGQGRRPVLDQDDGEVAAHHDLPGVEEGCPGERIFTSFSVAKFEVFMCLVAYLISCLCND